VPAAGAGGVDVEAFDEAALFGEVDKDALGEGAAADVAHADEEDAEGRVGGGFGEVEVGGGVVVRHGGRSVSGEEHRKARTTGWSVRGTVRSVGEGIWGGRGGTRRQDS